MSDRLWLLVLSFLVVVPLTGCIGADGDPAPSENPMRVTITTAYDAAIRPPNTNLTQGERDGSTDLPAGTPAHGLDFLMVVRKVPGHDYGEWEGDQPCTPGFRNTATGEVRRSTCPDTDGASEILVPPPEDRGGAWLYRFDAEGQIVLLFPEPVRLFLAFNMPYSEELEALRNTPDGCGDGYQPTTISKLSTFSGDVQDRSTSLEITGDGSIHYAYYGVCRELRR